MPHWRVVVRDSGRPGATTVLVAAVPAVAVLAVLAVLAALATLATLIVRRRRRVVALRAEQQVDDLVDEAIFLVRVGWSWPGLVDAEWRRVEHGFEQVAASLDGALRRCGRSARDARTATRKLGSWADLALAHQPVTEEFAADFLSLVGRPGLGARLGLGDPPDPRDPPDPPDDAGPPDDADPPDDAAPPGPADPLPSGDPDADWVPAAVSLVPPGVDEETLRLWRWALDRENLGQLERDYLEAAAVRAARTARSNRRRLRSGATGILVVLVSAAMVWPALTWREWDMGLIAGSAVACLALLILPLVPTTARVLFTALGLDRLAGEGGGWVSHLMVLALSLAGVVVGLRKGATLDSAVHGPAATVSWRALMPSCLLAWGVLVIALHLSAVLWASFCVGLRRYHEGREIPAGVATPLIEAAAALSRSTRAAPGDGALDLDQRSCLAALIDRAADNLTVIVARRLRLAGQAEQQVLDRACRAVVARLRGRTPALVAPDRFWDANDVADRIRDDVVLLLRGLWGSVTAGRDALGPEIPRTSWSFAAKVALLAFLPVTLLGAATVVALRLNVPWLKGAPVAWWSVIGWAVVTLLVGIDMGMSGGRPILAEAVKTLSSVAALVKGKEEGNAGGKG